MARTQVAEKNLPQAAAPSGTIRGAAEVDLEERSAWIYWQLRRHRITAAEIARSLGVTRRMVAYVINGQAESQRVKAALARALGLPFEKIWGDEAEYRRDTRANG